VSVWSTLLGSWRGRRRLDDRRITDFEIEERRRRRTVAVELAERVEPRYGAMITNARSRDGTIDSDTEPISRSSRLALGHADPRLESGDHLEARLGSETPPETISRSTVT
jgi:hypothetical protein